MECRKIIIGEHSFKQMFKKEILPEDVLDAVRNGEIIKEYSEDKPYPSFLILKFVKNKPLHVVVARNEKENLCFVITAYKPDPKLWSKDFKTKLYE